MAKPHKYREVVRILRGYDRRFEFWEHRGKGSERIVHHPDINGRPESFPVKCHGENTELRRGPSGLDHSMGRPTFKEFAASWDFRESKVFALHYESRLATRDWPRHVAPSELVDQVQFLPAILFCDAVTSDKRMKELSRRLLRKTAFPLGEVFHRGELVPLTAYLEGVDSD